MKDINTQYSFLTNNHTDGRYVEKKTLRISAEFWMLQENQEEFYQSSLTKPAEFYILDFDKVEDKLGPIKTLDHDFIADITFGFLIHNRHKEFFLNLDQSDIILHKAIVIGERSNAEDSIYEGYWLIATPHRPLDWVDIEKCKVVNGIKDTADIEEIYSVELKQSISNIPIEQRMIFDICDVTPTSVKSYMEYPLVHNSIVEYIKANDKTEQLLFLTTEQVHKKPGSLFN